MVDRDETYDFVVMGAGASGFSAALRGHDLGLSTLVLEKTEQYGGSTAMSGGVCWVANNWHMGRLGIQDSDEDALMYLQAITKGEVATDRLKSYLAQSKRMLKYLERYSHVRFDPLDKYSDYYPEVLGGKSGGRSMEARPFNGAKLKDQLLKMRQTHPQSKIHCKLGITVRGAHS